MVEVFINAKKAYQLIRQGEAIPVDCRHDLSDNDYGRKAYTEDHLPNARFAHLDDDLSGEISGKTGRHPLPELENFVQWVQNQGLHPNLPIICYDDSTGGIAARLWWMLTQIGFKQVKILTGGYKDWKDNNYPVENKISQSKKSEFEVPITSWNEGPYNIVEASELSTFSLIDARAPERYRGEEEPLDPIPGRIPGAINYFWKSNLQDDKLVNKDRLLENIDKLTMENSVMYCGSGVTACFNLAVFEEMDKPKIGFYPGSYSEWCRIHSDQIERDN